MKKLFVKVGDDWRMVFCHSQGKILTTEDKSKALPTKSFWAEDDLAYFVNKFANHEFKLA